VKWVTREHPKTDRIACPWLIHKFIDADAEIVFVPADDVLAYATREVSKIAGVRILGNAKEKASVLSFTLEGVHPHDIGTILDQQGIAIRAGHHCAQPVMDRFKVPATARASFAFYNTKKEVDALVNGIRAVMEVFS